MEDMKVLGFEDDLNDVWRLLELAAIHHGEQLAVVDQGCLLTYNTLYRRACVLASWFTAVGISRGDRIGILCRNSSHVIELHFAAAYLHAGASSMIVHLDLKIRYFKIFSA